MFAGRQSTLGAELALGGHNWLILNETYISIGIDFLVQWRCSIVKLNAQAIIVIYMCYYQT